ncbi:MAG: NAD(+)/NADH kinase [Gemmataceae bacterium]|nr:NAD(+)/NADH kinase [Gemmataceae bacterium]
MKVYVLGNAERPGVAAEVERWLPLLEQKVDVLVTDLRQECDLSALARADLALVFGGDGAILRAARQMAYQQVPVLGINLGRLGFLADIHPNDFAACFEQVVAQNFQITSHLMFECLVESSNPASVQTFLGLNEVVVHALPPRRMIGLELEVDGEVVSRFGGDGVIVSTPIGSTAHNLSAGGPILGQELAAFVITPICPHTLTYRPIVDSAEKTYTIRLGQGAEQAVVMVDGQLGAQVAAQHRIVIRKAPVRFHLVKVPGHTNYQTLRDKLGWGTSPNYRGEL